MRLIDKLYLMKVPLEEVLILRKEAGTFTLSNGLIIMSIIKTILRVIAVVILVSQDPKVNSDLL